MADVNNEQIVRFAAVIHELFQLITEHPEYIEEPKDAKIYHLNSSYQEGERVLVQETLDPRNMPEGVEIIRDQQDPITDEVIISDH